MGMSAAVVVTPTGIEPPLDVVAAFRIAYSDANRVVGRSGKGSGHPLLHFAKEDFCGGIAIDPVIVSMWAVNSSAAGANSPIAAPPHAPEYIGLEPLLQYVQGGQRAVHSGIVVPSVLPSLLAVIHTPAPSEECISKIKALLEQP